MAKEVLGNVDAQPLQTVMPVMDNILKTVREKEGIPSDPSARYLPALTRGELGKQVAVNEFKGVPPNKSPKEIRRWILDRVGDEDILNDYTQWEVGPKSGTKHTVNTNRGVKQWFAGETAQLIKDSIWLGRERHKNYPKSKIKWQHLLYAPFTYEGQLWVAKLRVNETIHGEKLRDTRFAEVKTLAKDSSEEPTPSTGTDASQVNVARLADIVKRLWPKDDVQLVRPENERRAKLDADLRIPDIIRNFDQVRKVGKNDRGMDVIEYTKMYENGEVFFFEEVRAGRHILAASSMRKKKPPRARDAN